MQATAPRFDTPGISTQDEAFRTNEVRRTTQCTLLSRTPPVSAQSATRKKPSGNPNSKA